MIDPITQYILEKNKLSENLDYALLVGKQVLRTSILLWFIVMTYKKQWSKAAKSCKGKVGKDKTLCITKYKLKASEMEMSAAKKVMSQCSKTKNPNKCKQKIQSEIKRIQKKIQKLKAKEIK